MAKTTNFRQSLKDLLRRKSVLRGDFTLSSGRKSNYYIDCKRTTLDPEGAVLTGHTILEMLDSHGIKANAIGGMTIGADPIVTAVAAVSYLDEKPLRGFLVRKEAKPHGLRKRIEGVEANEVSKVVIVDEVCTTGESTLEAIRAAEGAGMQVTAVVSLVDREEGGSELLRRKYYYLPVFTAKELLDDDGEGARELSETAKDTKRSTSGDRRLG
jgi:orotate phosphoribosyltransferase